MSTVSVDFDGVIHSYTSGWNGPVPTDPPVQGARDFINWLLDNGLSVVIFSTRAATPKGEEGIWRWLREWDFPSTRILNVTDKKPKAVLYIDDRGYRFNGDFKELQEFLEASNFQPGRWGK